MRAGILDERHGDAPATHGAPLDTRAVIGADPQLTDRQKAALLDIYDSFVVVEAKPARRRSSSSTKTSRTTSTTKSRSTTPRNQGA